MTKKVALFVEDGSEELEFIAPLDILRRGGVHVDLIGANDKDRVTTSHDVTILTDKKISDIENILEYDAIVVPGGIPGSTKLRDNPKIIEFYQKMNNDKKLVGAICAAPIVLSKAEILKEKNATSYPTFKEQVECKNYDDTNAVVIDGNVITAQGPNLAVLFGYELLTYLTDKENSDKVADAMLLPVLKNNLK